MCLKFCLVHFHNFFQTFNSMLDKQKWIEVGLKIIDPIVKNGHFPAFQDVHQPHEWDEPEGDRVLPRSWCDKLSTKIQTSVFGNSSLQRILSQVISPREHPNARATTLYMYNTGLQGLLGQRFNNK